MKTLSRKRAIRLSTDCLAISLLCISCHHGTGTQPVIPTSHSVIYVQSGKTGDGSIKSPLGTIAAALDSAATDTAVTTIRVSSGTYNERLTISKPIILEGGCDPSNKWAVNYDDPSIISSLSDTVLSAGLMVIGVDLPVTVRNFRINGPLPLDSGQAGYGLYVLNCYSVNVSRCWITAGSGVHGCNGRKGADGVPCPSEVTPENCPMRGGVGGLGQYMETSTPHAGETGFCDDGSQGGGAGGAINLNGAAGPDGFPGSDGAGGISTLGLDSTNFWPSVFTLSGIDGSRGISGCGGGGGGGAWGGPDGPKNVFMWGGGGGNGGNGGVGGAGGTGGMGGGFSIGVCAVNSKLVLSSSSVTSRDAGAGGNGGLGGAGLLGDTGMINYDCMFYCGGRGGDGGDGGSGGSGGGGAGGWSVGMLYYNCPIAPTLSNCSMNIGYGGDGGAGGTLGNSGAKGKRYAVYQLGN